MKKARQGYLDSPSIDPLETLRCHYAASITPSLLPPQAHPTLQEQASSTNKQPPPRVSVANGFCIITSLRLLPHFFVACQTPDRVAETPWIRSRSATSYKEILDLTPKSTLSVPHQPTFTSARNSRAA